MPLHTLPKTRPLMAYHPDGSPPRTQRPATDPTAAIAAAYPADASAAQALLARKAVAALPRRGRIATLGQYDAHATCETPHVAGTLVLVPMAGLHYLDAGCAEEDGADPGLWHALARDASGTFVDDPYPTYGCPSVLWAEHAGIDPEAALGLIETVLADPYLRTLLPGSL